jgi:hypothetical protein
MHRAHVILRYRPDGSGTAWVRRPHGGWRRRAFAYVADVLGWLGSATTRVPPVRLLAAQAVPLAEAGTPLVPRAGPDILRT